VKANFDRLQEIMGNLDKAEEGLQALRDNVDLSTKAPINDALRGAQAFRDALWRIDKALELEAAPKA